MYTDVALRCIPEQEFKPSIHIHIYTCMHACNTPKIQRGTKTYSGGGYLRCGFLEEGLKFKFGILTQTTNT